MTKISINSIIRKRWFKLGVIFVILLVILPMTFYGVLRNPRVQTYLVSKISQKFSKELNVNASIESIDISWFMDVELIGVYISDQKRDTLLYSQKIILDVYKFRYRKNILSVNSLTLEKPVLRLHRSSSDSLFNYQFLIEYFTSPEKKPVKQPNPWTIKATGLQIQEGSLSFQDDHFPGPDTGINFTHLQFRQLNCSLHRIAVAGDSVSAVLDRLSFIEESGFRLHQMKALVNIKPTEIDLKDLLIKTTRSSIETDLKLAFKNFRDFKDFIDNVEITSYFLPSEVDFRDIAFFAKELIGMKNKVIFSGEVQGRINKLKINDFTLEYGSFTKFFGNIRLTGLPDINETFIQLKINELHTNHYDLSSISLPGGTSLSVPEPLIELGNINIKGNFTGFYNDFVADAQFRTQIGSVTTDISLKTNTESGKLDYSGKLNTREFNLGLLTKQQQYFGKINMVADVTGSGFDFNTMIVNIDAVVDSLYFKGNNFREIRISGGVYQKKVSGTFQVVDPLLGLDFDGFLDLSEKTPVVDFVAEIHHADLNRLNLIQHDSLMNLKTKVVAHLVGKNPDQMSGFIQLDSTQFTMNRKTLLMKNLVLNVKSNPEQKKEINFNSDFADARLDGNFSYQNLLPAMKQWARQLLPSLVSTSPENKVKEKVTFSFELTLKEPTSLTGMFFPGLAIAPNTNFQGKFFPLLDEIWLNGCSDQITLNKLMIHDWYLEGASAGPTFKMITGCRDLEFADEKGLDNLLLNTVIQEDTVTFGLEWQNDNPLIKNTGNLKGYISVLSPEFFRFHLNQSNTIINDSVWSIPETNMVEINKRYIKITDMLFISGDEKISFDGIISSNPSDKMTIHFQGFDLSNTDILTNPQRLDLDGFVTGQLELTDLYHAPDFLSDITIKNFGFNKDQLGNAYLTTKWDPLNKALFVNADVMYQGNIGTNKIIGVHGYYYPDRKVNSLDFNISVDNLKVRTLSHYLSSFTSKLGGYASGNVTFKGTLKDPVLEGKVKIQRGSMLIDYLKTEYSFTHEFELGKNFIRINNAIVYDTFGNKTMVDGNIFHESFKKWRLDLNIKPEKAMVLNTTSRDNDLFYGRAFASGNLRIHGPTENIIMDIDAKTEKGTQFFLPINTAMDVSDNDFITFRSTRQDSIPINIIHDVEFHGVTLNFDLEVTPDATIKIFMPYDMGNIKGTGRGKIKMGINTRGQFNIFGDYKINNGSFLFTLQNVVNRLFEIQQGGKIIFTGDPYDIRLDLRAMLKLDVPLTGLRVTADELQSLNKKIPINCIIDLKGNLFKPEMTFGLSTPLKDAEINRILFSQLDTTNQQQMSEQMIFLLVLRQFKPMERSNPIDLNASVGSSSWDFLSSQLNGWLSQISKDFDIGVNYKPGDRLTDDELTVALSTQLFDERITIDGNIGYASGSNNPSTSGQNASNLVGDVKIEMKVTEDGRIKVKAFNKSNNVSFLENNAPYTQGVGIFFRKEFDSLKDLFRSRKKFN